MGDRAAAGVVTLTGDGGLADANMGPDMGPIRGPVWGPIWGVNGHDPARGT